MGNSPLLCCCQNENGGNVATIPVDAFSEAAFGESATIVGSSHVSAKAYSQEPHKPAEPPHRGPMEPGGTSHEPAPNGHGHRPPARKEELKDTEFAITVERAARDGIGLKIDSLDGVSAFVDDILPGAIKAWNDAHPDEMQIKVNDRILEVNGIRGRTDDLLLELKAMTTWKMVLQRPVEVRVPIDCIKTPSLGLALKYAPTGRSILISEVGDGAIREWNAGTLGHKLKPNDRIIEMNGTRGNVERLLEAAKDVERLEVAFLHYP